MALRIDNPSWPEHPFVKPANWEKRWSAPAAKFVKKIMERLQEEADDLGYNTFFWIMDPCQYPGSGQHSFVSLGIQKQGKQPNGNLYSPLLAYGFGYEEAYNWSDEYIDTIISRAIMDYKQFLKGDDWSPKKLFSFHDAGKEDAGDMTPPRASLTEPHELGKDIKAYQARLKEAAKPVKDLFDFEDDDEDEVDPLS